MHGDRRGVCAAVPCAIALLTAGFVPSATAADLTVSALVTPGTLYAGTGALAYFELQNLGSALTADYTAELVLTSDGVIDASDPVVATVSNDLIGWQSVLLSTATTAAPGTYRFGLRVLPVAGETNTGNNQLLGDEVDLLRVDLELADGSPLDFMARASDAETAPATVVVHNVGTTASVLIFSVEPTEPTPWLDLTPASGFTLAGGDPLTISIKALPLGLPQGVYSTVLRFQNWLVPSDFHDITVQLCVDDPKFTPGQRLIGDIDDSADQDVALFDALKGEVLRLKLRSPEGNLAARLELVDPDGAIETTLTWKHSPTYLLKSVKLARSGEYTLRIGGKGPTTGTYDIKTSCKLPKTAKPREFDVTVKQDDTASVSMLLLAGATVDLKFAPNLAFEGPLGLVFVLPDGTQIDLQAMVIQDGDGSVSVPDIVAGQTGEYQVILSGFGADPKAQVAVTIDPLQPTKLAGDIAVP